MNFHEEYDLLDTKARNQLKEEIEKRGGEYEFADGSEPIVAAIPYDNTADYIILKAFINDNGEVCMIGREVECDELVNISPYDVEGSHIPYIWDYMIDDND